MPARSLQTLEMEIGRAKMHFGLPATAAVVRCYEAGRDGVWLHRYLVSRGQSGDLQHEQGISKSGNRWVRALAINTAWAWLRFQPKSQLARWYQKGFGKGNSRLRKIGIVALARKLLIALGLTARQIEKLGRSLTPLVSLRANS
jgi:hypothetical protein